MELAKSHYLENHDFADNLGLPIDEAFVVRLYCDLNPDIAVYIRYMFENYDKEAVWEYGLSQTTKRSMDGDHGARMILNIWSDYIFCKKGELK